MLFLETDSCSCVISFPVYLAKNCANLVLFLSCWSNDNKTGGPVTVWCVGHMNAA